MIIKDLNNCTKKYSIVYTDPPWQQSRGGKKSTRPNSSGLPLTYKTMPLADIEELHRIFLRQCTEEKHNVFMWAIDKYLPEAEAMMKRLGYKLHAWIVWDKLNGPSPAFTLRFQTEYLLWFYKPGNIVMPEKDCRGKYSTIIREGSTVHSCKPQAAYRMLEDMFRNRNKIELFARTTRTGWDCFGDEAKEADNDRC